MHHWRIINVIDVINIFKKVWHSEKWNKYVNIFPASSAKELILISDSVYAFPPELHTEVEIPSWYVRTGEEIHFHFIFVIKERGTEKHSLLVCKFVRLFVCWVWVIKT